MTLLLESMGWAKTTGLSGLYYVNEKKRCAQKSPPYFDILNLDPTLNPSRETVFLAFCTKKMETEENSAERRLVIESYKCLQDQQSRVEYELANLSREAQKRVAPLLVLYKRRLRQEAEAAKRLAEEEARAAAEAEAAAAAAAAEEDENAEQAK